MAVTSYTMATDTLVTTVKGYLTSAQTTWAVETFNGTSADDLHGLLPGMRAPAAAVQYAGSQWNGSPLRRESDIDVYLVAKNGQASSAGQSIRGMVDSCVAAIDDQVSTHTHFQAVSDSIMDIGPGLSCAKVSFKAKDY